MIYSYKSLHVIRIVGVNNAEITDSRNYLIFSKFPQRRHRHHHHQLTNIHYTFFNYLHSFVTPAMASTDKYKLVYFTPPQYLSDINAAIFATGAGVYGEYSEVCFTTLGVGQFRPSSSANPTIGQASIDLASCIKNNC